mmetsp:Transcript_19500/g.58010  ORF Transcript_19500/g.58010 Transcript_19500/m.58010 type:complete len:272 (-) Transcript_19500:46-861(-)
MTSSMEPRNARRMTVQGSRCPKRWIRPSACASVTGFQQGPSSISTLAPVHVMPSVTRLERSRTRAGPSLRRARRDARRLFRVAPCTSPNSTCGNASRSHRARMSSASGNSHTTTTLSCVPSNTDVTRAVAACSVPERATRFSGRSGILGTTARTMRSPMLLTRPASVGWTAACRSAVSARRAAPFAPARPSAASRPRMSDCSEGGETTSTQDVFGGSSRSMSSTDRRRMRPRRSRRSLSAARRPTTASHGDASDRRAASIGAAILSRKRPA